MLIQTLPYGICDYCLLLYHCWVLPLSTTVCYYNRLPCGDTSQCFALQTSQLYYVASSMPALCALCSFMFIVNDINSFIYTSIASKVRGKVASIPFEQFHKHSAEIITAAVFGKNPDGKVNSEVVFSANNLVSDTLSC